MFPSKKAVSPVIAIVLLLMMTVAAAGAAYFWLTQMQSGIQEQSTKSIENIMQQSGRRLMAQAAICEPTTPESMVAWYEFYEGGGNKTHDSSRDENTGTIYGANWTDGKVGQALEFNASEHDYVAVSDSSSLDVQEELTLGAWFRSADGLKEEGDGWHGGIDKAIRMYGVGWQGWLDTWMFIMYDSSGTKYLCTAPDDTYAYADTWYHVMTVYNQQDMILYLNGEEVARTNVGDVQIGTTDQSFRIARYRHTYWNGTIDEVRLYDRALSAEEINETYKGKMKVKVTVRNVGSVSIPEAEFVANLKKDGTTVDSDTYVTKSSIDTGDLKTLTFYFNEMRPGGEYNINIPGIDVSQSVKCQSLES